MNRITSDVSAFVTKTYDILVVGGGTAGLALASRLSENPKLTIGVLEAGQDLSADPIVKSAGGWLATAFGPAYSWGFETTPQTHVMGQKMLVPRGKLLGGCSAINAMMWTRASRPEYDVLEELGNPGWTFDELVPYFKKTQSHTPQNNEYFPGTGTVTPYQGSDGPVKTSYNTWYSPLLFPFVESTSELSFAVNNNPNGGNLLGLSNISRCVDQEMSTRQHAGVTYLAQTVGRENISVLVGAHATRILFSETTGDLIATAVEFHVNGVKYVVRAIKEIVIAAGTYQTPLLLELSGIGMKSILSQHGIESRVELPVGENLQEHLMVNLNFALNSEALGSVNAVPFTPDLKSEPGKDARSTTTGGPFLFTTLRETASAQGHANLVSLLDSYIASETLTKLERAQLEIQRGWLLSQDSTVADMVVMFANLPGEMGLPLPDGSMTLWVPAAHLHPASRGSVHIASNDPLAGPAIDPKFFSRDYDLLALVQIVRLVQKITKTGPLASLASGPVAPPPDVETDEQLGAYIRANATSLFHPIGTAPMAPRAIGGVVDSRLKVYGAKNLRVVDASVIPLQLGTMPMSTVYVIAEKAADMIKEEHAGM